MRIGVRLLVVLAARAPQTPVFNVPVVTHLCSSRVRDVLADALIDLFVVENAVRPGRSKHRQRNAQGREDRETRRLPPEDVAVYRMDHEYGGNDPDQDARVEGPRLQRFQLFPQVAGRSAG